MDEIRKVVAEMRTNPTTPASGLMCCDWADRIERALQQPASADVEREAREIFGEEYRRTHEANPRCNFSEAEANCAIRAIAAALRKQQQEVKEAEPNDDAGVEFIRKHSLFIYEVDFGEEGKGRYVRLNDFNRVAALVPQQGAEPVAYIPEEMLARMRTDEIAGTMAHSRPEYCAYGTPVAVYTAPQPRSDLGQFREAVEFMRKRASDGMTQHANPRSEADAEAYEKAEADFDRYDRLLALIAEQEKGK